MRCLVCERFSLSHICTSCQKEHLRPSLFRRRLESGLEVVSFYRYREIERFLLTKHTDLGYYIYMIMAKNSFAKFAAEFVFDTAVASVAIDDRVKGGYAHTAVLNRALTCKRISPVYNALHAQNDIAYSGKSLAFRKAHSRNFRYRGFAQKSVILVDDIITTGTTIEEARRTLVRADKEVLFALTLADASL